jgi:hypothetical protein
LLAHRRVFRGVHTETAQDECLGRTVPDLLGQDQRLLVHLP